MASTIDGQTGIIGRSRKPNRIPTILSHIQIGINIDGHTIQKFGIGCIFQRIGKFFYRLNDEGHILIAAKRDHAVFNDNHLTGRAVGLKTPNQIRFVDFFQTRRNNLGNTLGLTINHVYLTNACRTQYRTDTCIIGIGRGQFCLRHRAILQGRICSGIRADQADKATDRARSLKMTIFNRTVEDGHIGVYRILTRLGVTLGNTNKSTYILPGHIGIDQMTAVNHHRLHRIDIFDQSTRSNRILALDIGIIDGQIADRNARLTGRASGKQRSGQTNQFFSISQDLNLLGVLTAIYINGNPHQICQADICCQTHRDIRGIRSISRFANHGSKFLGGSNDEDAFRIYRYIFKFRIGQIGTVPDRIILLG